MNPEEVQRIKQKMVDDGRAIYGKTLLERPDWDKPTYYFPNGANGTNVAVYDAVWSGLGVIQREKIWSSFPPVELTFIVYTGGELWVYAGRSPLKEDDLVVKLSSGGGRED